MRPSIEAERDRVHASVVIHMGEFTLRGHEEQTLLISAVRYAMGRSTYMPSLTCRILSSKMGDMEPSTAAIIARDIREWWDDFEGPESSEKYRTQDVYYSIDVEPFLALLPMLDERSKELEWYGTYIPYLPSRYSRWADVPEEIRTKENA